MGTLTNSLSCTLAAILFTLVTCTLAAPPSEESDKPTKDDIMLLAKLLQDPETEILSDGDDETVNSIDQPIKGSEMSKRQSDTMEYGWGGGRFGKRSSDLSDYGWGGGRFGKRYDQFSVGGRFGKRYDQFSVGGRFGKRGLDMDGDIKRYDMYSVGGRFGKRYDPYTLGGRFGKRGGMEDAMKRYDMYSVGGRFGKRDGDKRYDMYSVGGRFGRDTSSQMKHAQEGSQ